MLPEGRCYLQPFNFALPQALCLLEGALSLSELLTELMPELLTEQFCLFDHVADTPSGGQIWTCGNANFPEINKAFTKLRLNELASNKIVRLKAPDKQGLLPFIWDVLPEVQPESFGQACRDNCATAIAIEHRYGPGTVIQPDMFESYGAPLAEVIKTLIPKEELEYGTPEELITHKQALEKVELLHAQLLHANEITTDVTAQLLRVMALLR